MATMDRNNYSQNNNGKPLFCLSAPARPGFEIPNTLKGTFARNGADYYFLSELNPGADVLKLKFWKTWNTDITKRLAPLIVFLAEEKLLVKISGNYLKNNGVYAVSSIRPEPVVTLLPNKAKYSPAFLDVVISRLLKSSIRYEFQEKLSPPLLEGLDEIEAYFKLCKHTFPPCISETIQRELEKARGEVSDHRRHARTALQYLINIDWSKKDIHVPTVEESRAILDSEFYGLETVKSRILEIIAQIHRTGELPKWGILLNGPAGTGKTSIAKAIARLLNMPQILLNIPNIGNDPEELSGSSRIYGNGKPGYFIDRFLEARSGTGVLLINEIDKATDRGKDGKAGSADTLLTLLDRQGYRDNFLECDIPTDGLFAIATCNDLGKLSTPLKDRFYVINIPSYTPSEKRIIWNNHVIPNIMSTLRLKSHDQFSFSEDAVDELVKGYAIELGVRDLEQYAERFAGVICTMLSENGDDYRYTFTKEDVTRLLGPSRVTRHAFALNPGEINAVFYYEGAARFFLLEASVCPGSGEFLVLGPIPELQRDYIRVAYECIKKTVNFDLSNKDVSIFIPHTIPACADNHIGFAAYAAIYSLILNTSLAIQDTAFIGGVDLNGNLYFDDSDIIPLVRAVKEANIKTIYAPMEVSKMISSCGISDCHVTVMEAQNAQHLVSMAVATNKIN